MNETTGITCISNKVKGIQNPLKTLKIFNYLKKTSSNSALFLHDTHSSSKDETKWKDEFKGGLFSRMEIIHVGL